MRKAPEKGKLAVEWKKVQITWQPETSKSKAKERLPHLRGCHCVDMAGATARWCTWRLLSRLPPGSQSMRPDFQLLGFPKSIRTSIAHIESGTLNIYTLLELYFRSITR